VESLFPAAISIPLEPCGNRIKDLLVAERLGQKVNRSGLHGLDGHWNITVSSDKDDRHFDA
jgi:hypothetical protein